MITHDEYFMYQWTFYSLVSRGSVEIINIICQSCILRHLRCHQTIMMQEQVLNSDGIMSAWACKSEIAWALNYFLWISHWGPEFLLNFSILSICCLIATVLSNLHLNSKWVILLASFYRWRNRRPVKINNLLKTVCIWFHSCPWLWFISATAKALPCVCPLAPLKSFYLILRMPMKCRLCLVAR